MPNEITPEPETLESAAPAAEEQAPNEKIVFDEKQQARINELLREAQGRSAREVRAENKRLQLELESARKAPTPAEPSADVLIRLAQAESERDSLRASAQDATIKATLQDAVASENFCDPALAAQILKSSVRLIDGKATVIDPATGEPQLNASFEPVTVAEAAKNLAKAKPFLVRSNYRPGSGSTPSMGSPSTQPRLEDLFGPKSNGGLANKLSLSDPRRYRQLRAIAQEKGLL